MPRVGLRALGINLDPIKHLTIEEVFGVGILSIPEFNKRFWLLVKSKNLKVKVAVPRS